MSTQIIGRSVPVLESSPEVFLSHSAEDKPSVERIARGLREAGIEPWFDTWCLTPGGDWQSEIAAGIRAARSCAVFVGPGGFGDWELQELGLALDRAAKDRHFRVFAVLLPGVPEPFDPISLPPFISTRTWVDFRGGFNDRRVFQRLVNAVMGVPVGAEEAPPEPTQMCPYQGLQTFDEEHAEFFFGRAADVQRLLERLKERRFLSVLGPSGSGKSSLVRAGLVSALRRGALPGSDAWPVVVMRPGGEPSTTLAAHLLDLGGGAGTMQATVDLLAEDRRTLHLAVMHVMASAVEQQRALVVVDQFEEAFTLTRDDSQRQAFFDNLLHAALAPGGRTFVVVTMRADFYPRCASYPELAQAISANQFLAWPMEEWALAEAIEEPARAVGLELEEGLTDQILADLRRAPGALPLMEHALLELWERRRGTMLTLEAYREVGGVAGSLAKRAEHVYEGMAETDRVTARRVLLRLTEPGEGTEDTRRRAAFDELVGAGVERDQVERVVSQLTDSRLLTTGTDPGGTGRHVEVAHEALIRGWPRLREWLDEDRSSLRLHRRLTEAAEEWQRSGGDPDALYRGLRLAQASEWSQRELDALNALEAAFLRESLRARDRGQRRRRRRVQAVAAGLVSGLVVVAVLAVVAFVQRDKAEDQSRLAQSREIAASALEQLERDPQLSLLLAIEAYERAATVQADAALRTALVSSHLRRLLPVGAPDHVWADVSPDGELIATGAPGGEVALWERASGRRRAVLRSARKPDRPGDGEPAPFVSFSPDGKRLFASGLDGAPAPIWSVPDGRVVARLKGRAFFAGGWTPEGRSVLTHGRGVARLWDAGTGVAQAVFRGRPASNLQFEREYEPEGEERESEPSWGFAALSPDGRLVALEDGEDLRVVEVSSGRTRFAFEGRLFTNTVGARAFSRDGRRLVAEGPDDSARVFDVATGRLLQTIRRGPEDVGAAFSPDGTRLVTGHRDGARIWDLERGRRLLELSGHAGAVEEAVFSPDGELVLTSSGDSTARIWDGETGRVLATLAGHAGPTPRPMFTRDGRFVVTAGNDVRVWEVGGAAAAVLRGRGPVLSARFSRDGKSIVSSEEQHGVVRVWDLGTRRPRTALRLPPSPGAALYTFADLSADGRLAVTSGGRFTHRGFAREQEPIRLWDLATGKVRLELDPPREDPLGICPPGACVVPDAALRPDGRRLVTAGADGFLRIWDAAKGTAIDAIELGSGVSGVAWTPDGRKLLALDERALELVDATTGRRIHSFGPKSSGSGTIPALDPDVGPRGSLVAAGYPDRMARVWETATRRLVAELPHAGPVSDVAFSPDGRFLVTAAGDAPTIWDLRSRRPLVEFFGHQGRVGTVDFSPGGRTVLSGGDDGSVRIWRCEVCTSVDRVLRLARSRVTRRLTRAERADFLHERG